VKKRVFTLSLVLCITVGLVLTTITAAQAFGPFAARATGPRALTMADLTRFYDFLDLTDEQKGELQKYQAEQFKQNEELRLESRKLFFELRQMALEKNPKEELIQKKIERFNELRQIMYEQRNEHRGKMWSLLTEEQRKRIESLRKQRGRRDRGRIYRRGWE